MKILTTLALLGFCCSIAAGQNVRIALAERSNVSSAEIGKSLDKHCPGIVVTADASRAEYHLEAIDTGAGAARKPYKFTLFDQTGDRIFSTETARVDSAVKNVCTSSKSANSKHCGQPTRN